MGAKRQRKKNLVPSVKKPLYAVAYWEYERGWGSRIDGYTYHATQKTAMSTLDKFNAKNAEVGVASVPDWYMVARYVGLTDKPY